MKTTYKIELHLEKGDADWKNNTYKENRYVILDSEGYDIIGEHMPIIEAINEWFHLEIEEHNACSFIDFDPIPDGDLSIKKLEVDGKIYKFDRLKITCWGTVQSDYSKYIFNLFLKGKKVHTYSSIK